MYRLEQNAYVGDRDPISMPWLLNAPVPDLG
jgi:hypothetical protein